MAIVPNWADPLKDTLLKQMSRAKINCAQIEKYRNLAALLQGTAASEALEQGLAKMTEALDQRYESAVKQTGSDVIGTVENGIQTLEQLGGYRDSARIIGESKERVRQLRAAEEERARLQKRRKTRITVAVAAVLVAIIAVIIVRQGMVERENRRLIADAQAQADAGKDVEAIDTITALTEKGIRGQDYPEIYSVTETVLENTAAQEGYDAAFARYDSMRSSIPDAVEESAFTDYAASQLDGTTLTLAEKWDVLLLLQDRNCPAKDAVDAIADDYLSGLPADEAGKAAEDAVNRNLLKSDSDAVLHVVARIMEDLPAREAWQYAMGVAGSASMKKDDAFVEKAIERLGRELPAGETWTLVADAVEGGKVGVKVAGVRESVEKAIEASSGEDAWAFAQRAVDLKVMESGDDLMWDAFVKYVNSIDITEAWPVVYNARKEKTLPITDNTVAEVYSKYVQKVPVETAWAEIDTYREDGLLSVLPRDALSQLGGAYLDGVAAELVSGAGPDVTDWASAQRTNLETVPIDPDAALRFVYALNSAGCDVDTLFPQGICVNIPVAARVCGLTNDLVRSATHTGVPNMSVVLPVSIVEQNVYSGKRIYNITAMMEQRLNESVAKRQGNDAAYVVRLLPKYLFRLPEDSRPASFADCTGLICMQQSYLYSGRILHETKNQFQTFLNTSTYYPYFTALDMVSAYDLGNESLRECISLEQHPAQVEDNKWFEMNKNTGYLFTDSNMLGSFDAVALEESYSQAVDQIEVIRVIMLINHSNQTEENTDEADG